jgi:uncharacterized membrane protein
MSMYERRLQILIDDERYRRVAAAARDRGSSVAAVIRDAIDAALPADLAKKRTAAKAILAARPMQVPDVDELKRELDDVRAGGR